MHFSHDDISKFREGIFDEIAIRAGVPRIPGAQATQPTSTMQSEFLRSAARLLVAGRTYFVHLSPDDAWLDVALLVKNLLEEADSGVAIRIRTVNRNWKFLDLAALVAHPEFSIEARRLACGVGLALACLWRESRRLAGFQKLLAVLRGSVELQMMAELFEQLDQESAAVVDPEFRHRLEQAFNLVYPSQPLPPAAVPFRSPWGQWFRERRRKSPRSSRGVLRNLEGSAGSPFPEADLGNWPDGEPQHLQSCKARDLCGVAKGWRQIRKALRKIGRPTRTARTLQRHAELCGKKCWDTPFKKQRNGWPCVTLCGLRDWYDKTIGELARKTRKRR
ncbi:MAG: hypothetical protein FD180_166 [Planctomycetota bacterium]|nr:MAG: hypothetical protein FD180_166 [Planctomycetota bacterium]